MLKLCTKCLKQYGEDVAKVHPPIYCPPASEVCCGVPSDCETYLLGQCNGTAGKP